VPEARADTESEAPAEAAAASPAAEASSGAAAPATEPAEDVWVRFAPEPEQVPSRWQRVTAAVGRVVGHEWTLASLAGLLLAVAMTWPTLRHPTQTLPQDIWDPTLQAWQLSWSGHILTTDPTQLWNGNGFYPEAYSYAFSDTVLGYAPFGLIGHGPVAAVVRYNIVFVLAYALAIVGPYALVRQLGASRTGAAVAGVAFAFAPWRLAQAGHLHVMSSGGIALALAMLARGHGYSLRYGYRPDHRHAGWALAGWLVAAWQITLGFGIGLVFAYVLLATVVVAAVMWWIRRQWFWAVRRPFGIRLLVSDLVGGFVFAAVALFMALPYMKVLELHPNARRSTAEVEFYSPPLRGFFTAPGESWLWGERHEAARAVLPWQAEMTLLPGFALYGLAAAGLIFSIWRLHTRLLLAAGVLVTIALGMGTRFIGGRPGFMTLHDTLPGWDGIRTPGRLVLWTTLLLGILAAGAVSAYVDRADEATADRVPSRPGPWLRLATLVPLALVLVEGINKTPHPVVPREPAAMHAVQAPLLILPTDLPTDQNVMLWSTDGFPKMVNGSSGFVPASQQRTRDAVANFPDEASVTYLRDLGVKTVILLRDRVGGTPWEQAADRPFDHLNLTRDESSEAVIYHLG
jgi:hypothetical protein